MIYVIKYPAGRPDTKAIVNDKPTGAKGEESMEEDEFKKWLEEQPDISEPSAERSSLTIEERLAAVEAKMLAVEAKGSGSI